MEKKITLTEDERIHLFFLLKQDQAECEELDISNELIRAYMKMNERILAKLGE